jgi:hypothetical protein
MAHDGATGRFFLRIELHRLAHGFERGDVRFRLLQILLPFPFEVGVLRACNGRLVDLDAAHFVLERLQNELFDLIDLH